MRRLFSLLAAFLLCGGLAVVPAASRASDRNATDFVRSLSRDLMTVAHSDRLSSAERDARLRGLLTDGFDLPEVARFVLGRFWTSASAPQRREYLGLFADYLAGTYSRLLRQADLSDFVVTSADKLESEDILVHTRFDLGGGFPVNWSLRLRAGTAGYRIVDLTSNGVSMAVTYRSEFGALIASRGFDGLLRSLRQRSQAARAESHGRVSMLLLVASLGSPGNLLALRMLN